MISLTKFAIITYIQSKHIRRYLNIINVDVIVSWEAKYQAVWSSSQLKNILASTQKAMGHGVLRKHRVLKHSAIYY